MAVAFSASDMPCAWAMLIVMVTKEIKTRDEMRKGKVLEIFCIWISLIVVLHDSDALTALVMTSALY